MDARSPETLALAGLLFAAIAISAAGDRRETPKPHDAAAMAAADDACQGLSKNQVAGLLGESVPDARALPGLGGPDCYYTLAAPSSDLLVQWTPGQWSQESARLQTVGAVKLEGAGAPAIWIPREHAVEAQAPDGRILFVGFWSDHGALPPANAKQLAAKVAQAALADRASGLG